MPSRARSGCCSSGTCSRASRSSIETATSFAKPAGKRGRYYLTDNFLRAWLAALANPIQALNFAPVARLIEQADERLTVVEGHALEKLVAVLYEERSRKGLGDFSLTSRIQGFWDSADTEIDLVALNEPERRIRFGSCKRTADRLVADLSVLDGHVTRFLAAYPKYASWQIEKVSIAPAITPEVRERIHAAGHLAQDLTDLTAEFH